MKLHVGLLLVFLQGSNSGSIFGSPPKKVICSWLWWCSIAKINRISFYPSSQLGRPTRIFSQSFTIKKHPLGIFPHSFPWIFSHTSPVQGISIATDDSGHGTSVSNRSEGPRVPSWCRSAANPSRRSLGSNRTSTAGRWRRPHRAEWMVWIAGKPTGKIEGHVGKAMK